MTDKVESATAGVGTALPNVWCVHADKGLHTHHFVSGGYFGYGGGWPDMSACRNREDIRVNLAPVFPSDTSPQRLGQYVGMMASFLWDIQAGDWVITPESDRNKLRYGKVASEDYRYEPGAPDGCPYTMRRNIAWANEPLIRDSLPMPLQYTLRAQRSVFKIRAREDFLAAIGQVEGPPSAEVPDPYRAVIRQVLQLNADEFEYLVGHLLVALGFEDTKVTGGPGDGGVDVIGELNVSGLAIVKLSVQVKRYGDQNITAADVRDFRANLSSATQGAFITTAGYDKAAYDAASEPGFPRIGLIDGRQLVDLLVEHWGAIPQDFQEQLRLKPGLVPA